MEDSRIVDLYLLRNEMAIDRTAEKYGKRIRHLAYSVCGDNLTAEECENDTYLGAWNSIPPHEPRNYLLAFLLKITRAVSIDRVKLITRKKRNVRILSLSAEIEESIQMVGDVESEAEAKVIAKSISDFLREQKVEVRGVFIRRYWYLESIREISVHYNISEGKVKSILFRCRKALKKYLEKEGFCI